MAASARKSSPPAATVVTLTSDFGTRDAFVGIMKGVILRTAPAARLVDLTHDVPPQNVLAGAYALAGAARWFPRGTIHVAVVDPGVGARRRALLVETTNAWFVGPDNGLLSLAAPAAAVRRVFDVSRSPVRLRPVSRTFHGRDVFAPVAAALAAGVDPRTLGTPLRAIARLRTPAPRRHGGKLVGTVLWADGFGNLATNVGRAHLARAAFLGRRLSITIEGHVLPFRPSYASVPAGRALALVNSSDVLEIAVNRGSAAERFDVRPGTTVTVERV
ncbi:MAG: SAM-dependent chlorinase/fluorinase [Deltaproteobacteria bacterium]|nr:SAM-dependent chlorinase/fluorinase [Deltaproteobacteria bacterium]